MHPNYTYPCKCSTMVQFRHELLTLMGEKTKNSNNYAFFLCYNGTYCCCTCKKRFSKCWSISAGHLSARNLCNSRHLQRPCRIQMFVVKYTSAWTMKILSVQVLNPTYEHTHTHTHTHSHTCTHTRAQAHKHMMPYAIYNSKCPTEIRRCANETALNKCY